MKLRWFSTVTKVPRYDPPMFRYEEGRHWEEEIVSPPVLQWFDEVSNDWLTVPVVREPVPEYSGPLVVQPESSEERAC